MPELKELSLHTLISASTLPRNGWEAESSSSLALQQPMLPAVHTSWRMLFQGNAAYALHMEM